MMQILDQARVLSVGPKGTVAGLGGDLWYQVECGGKKGWVFGALLYSAEYRIK